jgi:stress response protein SCP2
MAINLSKGQTISLKKTDNDLSQVTIGLGWDIAKPKKGLLGSLFSKKEPEYDLDVVAFLLNDRGQMVNLGSSLVGGDIVFYNSMRHPTGDVWLTGDNRTGAGDGDDEQIIVRLDQLDRRYGRIVFVVQIYKGNELNQDFGSVDNAFIRAVDARGREMARYDITARSECAGMRSLKFAELVRSNDGWQFHAIGKPYVTDTFVQILEEYVP